jgi:hypothetical protein
MLTKEAVELMIRISSDALKPINKFRLNVFFIV